MQDSNNPWLLPDTHELFSRYDILAAEQSSEYRKGFEASWLDNAEPGKGVPREEAQRLLDNGLAFISFGGYTFLSTSEGHHYYFAFGTFPGCLRGGPPNDLSKFKGPFHVLTLKDIIKRQGFYPTVSMMTVIRYQISSNDYSVDLSKMIDHCVDCGFSPDKLKDPRYSKVIFQNHFRDQKERRHE